MHEKASSDAKKLAIVTEIATKIEAIKIEIDQNSEKISQRIKKLEKQTGSESVMTYRHDSIIHDAIIKIRDLYCEGEEICIRYHLGEQAYKIFSVEPTIIQRLELSDEQLLPLITDRK